jgi:hypothetical protein
MQNKIISIIFYAEMTPICIFTIKNSINAYKHIKVTTKYRDLLYDKKKLFI